MKRIVVLSDMQIPYQDKRATRAVMNFVADYEPDELFCVGDEADSPEPSRWNKGLAGEFEGTLQKGLDETTKIMTGFKEALGDKPFHTMRSNHGDRIQNYVTRYAPALASLRDLEYSKLLRYAENEITYHDRFFSFTPGWILAHGDEGRANKQPGGTALTLLNKLGLRLCVDTRISKESNTNILGLVELLTTDSMVWKLGISWTWGKRTISDKLVLTGNKDSLYSISVGAM